MAIVLFDTNIIIDNFKGIREAFDELSYYPDAAISTVTWMEIMAGTSAADAPRVRRFLDASFRIIQTDEAIMNAAAAVRAASIRIPPKIALPDAIIMATGAVTNRLVITRNKKDFTGTQRSYSLRAGNNDRYQGHQRHSSTPLSATRIAPSAFVRAALHEAKYSIDIYHKKSA